jgi:hypothetical protein
MGVSLDDLIALVKQRGTSEAFPEREELHGLLEPFRALPDQESVRLALAATLRKGDRLVARVTAEALAFLAKEAAGPLLVAIAMDEGLATSQRAAAVLAMDHHLPSFREQLAPEEQLTCMSLPVFEMLEDPEADQGFGLRMLLGSYVNLPSAARGSFLSAIMQAARERGHRLAGLGMHLLAAEEDAERRRRLLDLVAADGTQEAVDLLATFVATASDAEEAEHARRHLHELRAKGLRGVARPDLRETRALVTGVDGDACFSVNLIIPRVPTFDLVNLLFHLETGLRDGFVLRNLPSRSVDDVIAKIQQGCGTITCFLPMALAARIVDEGMPRTKPAVLRTPDLAEVLTVTEPVLAEARQTAWSEPVPPTEAETTLEEVDQLLDSKGFESWFFETHEATVREALAPVAKLLRGKRKPGARALANRMAKATEELRERLRADSEHLRLQHMLRHQARLLEQAGDVARSGLCRKLAVEVERPGSVFLTHMAARAIGDALQEAPDEQRPSRFVEAREHLRARLGQREHGYRKQDVAYLDMAAAAHTEMVIRNREAPSAQRVALADIETAALVLGEAFADGMSGGKRLGQLVEEFGNELEARELFPTQERPIVARELVSGLAEFVRTVCNAACPHRCFDDPAADGRVAFYAEGLPWHESPITGTRRTRNEA